MTTNSPVTRYGSGKAVRRIEDDSLLTGRDQFADNFSLPGQAYLVLLRSPHAHARIAQLDVTQARALPGVLAIYTGADLAAAGVKPIPASADFKRADKSPTATPPQHVLAQGTVRYVGEAVAAVVAFWLPEPVRGRWEKEDVVGAVADEAERCGERDELLTSAGHAVPFSGVARPIG